MTVEFRVAIVQVIATASGESRKDAATKIAEQALIASMDGEVIVQERTDGSAWRDLEVVPKMNFAAAHR